MRIAENAHGARKLVAGGVTPDRMRSVVRGIDPLASWHARELKKLAEEVVQHLFHPGSETWASGRAASAAG